MKKSLYALFVFLLCCTSTYSQIKVDEKHHVANFHPGYCGWCCIETLGRYHGITELYDLAKKRSKEPGDFVIVINGDGAKSKEPKCSASFWSVHQKLTSLKVKFYTYPPGRSKEQSIGLVEYAIRNKLGCVFGVHAGCMGKGSLPHAMILTDLNKDQITYIDPNHPGKEFTQSRQWFDYWHTGWVVIVEK